MASAMKKRSTFMRTALHPKAMPTKIAPARLQELAKRTADWERRQDEKASKPT